MLTRRMRFVSELGALPICLELSENRMSKFTVKVIGTSNAFVRVARSRGRYPPEFCLARTVSNIII